MQVHVQKVKFVCHFYRVKLKVTGGAKGQTSVTKYAHLRVICLRFERLSSIDHSHLSSIDGQFRKMSYYNTHIGRPQLRHVPCTCRFLQLLSAIRHSRSVDQSQQPCVRRHGNFCHSDVRAREKVRFYDIDLQM